MGSIQWDSAWDIGHSEIDHQHQRWVELFNELDNAFLSKEVRDIAVVQRNTFKAVLDYTRYHFASEEKLMQDVAYPDAAGHWRLHKEFDNIVYEKYREFENGELMLTSELLALIKNWLLHHIQVEDKKLGNYLLEKS
ncbi:MAG: bacteriohemerythrin [Pseudomonadota bacterium]